MKLRTAFGLLTTTTLAVGSIAAWNMANGHIEPNALPIENTSCTLTTDQSKSTTAIVTQTDTGQPLLTAKNLTLQNDGTLRTQNYYTHTGWTDDLISLPTGETTYNIRSQFTLSQNAQFEINPQNGTCSLHNKGLSATKLVFGGK